MRIANCKMQIDRNRCGVFALVVFAIGVRVAAVLAVGSYKLDHVTYEHGEIARNLVEGRGFVVRWMGAEGPTSQQAPVYPALVAVFYGLFGVETPTALLALQILQCVIGGALTGCVVMLAGELLPERPSAGWLAGIGTALYPTVVYTATQVQVASVATILVVVVLWIAARAGRSRSMFEAAACGAASGLLVLTDPILGLVVLVALGMIWKGKSALTAAYAADPRRWFSQRFPFSSVQLIAVALSAFVAVVTPWIMRNYVVHGELVFVKSTFGYAFWQGNHPRSFGTDKIPVPPSSEGGDSTGGGLRALEQSLWRSRLIDTLYIDDAVLPNERIAELGQFSEPERSRQLMAEVVEYIQQHPGHYLRLCLKRLRFFLLFDETNPKSRVWVYRAGHVALQVMALAGLWLSRRFWRQLWPTYLVFVLVTAFHTLTIVSARFHIPLEPIQILWAGCGVAEAGRLAATAIGFDSRHPHMEPQMAAAA